MVAMSISEPGFPPWANCAAASLLDRLSHPWSDTRAERTLGAVSLLVCAAVVAMVVFVAIHAWPTFHYNGLSWLGSGGNVGRQLAAMQTTTQHPPPSAYHLRAWQTQPG